MRSRLATGSLWITAGRVVTNLLSFVGLLLLARYLLPGDFGLVAIAVAIMGMLSTITSIPLGAVLIRHDNPTPNHLNTAWTLSLLRGVILASAMVGSGWLVAQIYDDARLFPVMAALALCPLIDGLRNPRSALLLRDLVFRQQALIQISEKLSAFIVSVTIAIIYNSYWALAGAWIAGSVVAAAASYFVLPFRPKFSLRRWREFYSFSVWVTLSQIVAEITWRFDQLIVGRFLGPITLGYYRVGSDLAQMPSRELVLPLTATLFPAFASLRNDMGRLAQAYSRAQALTSAIALPAGVGAALIAEPLVLLFMTEKWALAIPVIQALSAIFALQTLGSLASPLALAMGETRLLFKRDLQMLVVRIPIVVAGMIAFGLPGVIWGRVITGLIAIPVNLSVVRRLAGPSMIAQLAGTMRSLISVAVMAAGLLTLDYILDQQLTHMGTNSMLLIKIIASILCGVILYISAHAVLWRMARRPDGPEREIFTMLRSMGLTRVAETKE